MDAVIHITHWKAGSTWIRRILKRLYRDRVADREPGEEPFAQPVAAGAIASAYATRQEVEAAGLADCPRFVVLRDPRDTLVSAYFSFRDTHPDNEIILPLRDRLLELDLEEGMVFLMDGFMRRIAAIHESWRDEPIIRYEDLLRDDLAILRRVLTECGLEVSEAKLRRVVVENRFRSLTGRERGEEAPEHLRKAVPGDWRNHFTPRIRREFDARFGSLRYD